MNKGYRISRQPVSMYMLGWFYLRVIGTSQLKTEEGKWLPHRKLNGIDQPFVDRANKSEEDDTYDAEPKTKFSHASAVEISYDRFVIGDPHCLHHAEVVVEGDYRVDEGDEHEHVESHRVGGAYAREDEDLAEETSKWRNTGE